MSNSGLKQRISSAAVFCTIIIAGIYFNKWSFLTLFNIIAVLTFWEFTRITFKNADGVFQTRRRLIGALIGISIYINFALMTLNENFAVTISLYLTMLAILGLFIFELYAKSTQPLNNIAQNIFAILYIVLPFSLLGFIAFEGGIFYPNRIMGILLLVWANDSGAYFTGKQFGKTKLFPRISPNKTWEGTIGGGIVALTVAFIFSLIWKEFTTIDWMVIGLFVAVFGSLGDLIESMFKRSLDIKDSGSIMPGHGGLLDRFDSFIFLIPFIIIYLQLFK